VYKTIEVKNPGNLEWPKGVSLIGSGDIKGEGVL